MENTVKEVEIFLGGTCNGSKWRDKLTPLLEKGYFNPVVEDWTPECEAEEIKWREEAKICLYVISPVATGFLSIAEVVQDSNSRPERTYYYILQRDTTAEGEELHWSAHQKKSLDAIGRMIERNGATWCKSWDELITKLNN